jgi:hypothetical protein
VKLTFTLLSEPVAIARLAPSEQTPAWAAGAFVSVTRTAEELSIVSANVPAGVRADRGWRCLKLEGPFALTETGVAAEFTALLARAGVSVFILSTYDTDYVLVKDERLESAKEALRGAGHVVR